MTAGSQPRSEKPRICVCICTYRRPRLLAGLLIALDRLETGGIFDYSIVVVDNDRSESGRQIVESEAARSKTPIRYFVEPEQNIAMARNKAIANAQGDFLAFIDDDELPEPRWLLHFYKAMALYQTAGVLGPVLPRYEAPPPAWILKGRFFDRPTHRSGYALDWHRTRAGNCLIRKGVFEGPGPWFLPIYGSGGEDRDFFKRMISRGHKFVWCNEAPVHELVPRERMKKTVMLKRALLRGKMAYHSQKGRADRILASGGAVLIYSLGLPFLLVCSPIFGYDVFMRYLVKDCDHLGKLLAMLKVDLVKDRYIT
jgi:succinoglycan biosynthesis protein ExoM